MRTSWKTCVPSGFLALALCLLPACLEVKPKVLGSNKKIDFSQFDIGTQSSFKFNFALLTTASTGNVVFLQGSANTKGGLVSTCNFQGTSCICEFQKSDGSIISSSSSADISYDSTGNYFRCKFGGDTTRLAKVRIHNLGDSVTSTVLDVATSTTLTVGQLIGNELDINKVRTVFRYSCQFNFLQKEGTTTQGFDCTNAQVSCDPNGIVFNNFCILQARFPFFLFSDNLSNNFGQKKSDKVYNGGGGSNGICGQQIKQFNCADDQGTPVKQFGLFAEQIGIWDTSVQLPSGPDQIPVSYGFAARISATTSDCPPGLTKMIFYRVAGGQGVVTSDIHPSHNFTSNLDATEVSTPDVTPTAFRIQKISQGHCDPGLVPPCSMPVSFATDPKDPQAYSSSGQTAFCVIPQNILP